jgi:hypothetical protein
LAVKLIVSYRLREGGLPTFLAVPKKSLLCWRKRFHERGVEFDEATSDFGEEMLFLKIRTVFNWNSSVPRMRTRSRLGALPDTDRTCWQDCVPGYTLVLKPRNCLP